MLQFDLALFANYAAVMAATKQVGADSVIAFDTADTITLKGVTMASLTSTDFKFG